MEYVAMYDNNCGRGETLTAAFNDLQDNYGDVLAVSDCSFGEFNEILVVQEVKQVQVTTSTIKKVK